MFLDRPLTALYPLSDGFDSPHQLQEGLDRGPLLTPVKCFPFCARSPRHVEACFAARPTANRITRQFQPGTIARLAPAQTESPSPRSRRTLLQVGQAQLRHPAPTEDGRRQPGAPLALCRACAVCTAPRKPPAPSGARTAWGWANAVPWEKAWEVQRTNG